jgi:hypothetical protein
MQLKRWQKIALWAIAGYVLLGGYVVIPDMRASGWNMDRPGIWIGTFLGASFVGALIAGTISFFVIEKLN